MSGNSIWDGPNLGEEETDPFPNETLTPEEENSAAISGTQNVKRRKFTHIEGDGTHMQLYVRSMGKLLAVTAVFKNDDDCNAYLETHADEGVIAQGGGLVMVAHLYDHDVKAELPLTNDHTRLYLYRAEDEQGNEVPIVQGPTDKPIQERPFRVSFGTFGFNLIP